MKTDKMENKKILITGGSGSLGNYIVPYLLGKNCEIAIYSRDEFKQSEMKKQFPNLNYFIGDVRNIDRVKEVVRIFKPEIIIHAAAMKRIEVCEENPFETVLTDIIGGKNIVEVSKENNLNAIGVSTDKSVKPVNVYGMCKAVQEKIFVQSGFNCVRYGNVIGSRGSVIPLFKKQAKENKPLTVTNPKMTRFLLPLDHSIELIFNAIEEKSNGSVFVRRSPAAKVEDIAKIFSDNIKIIGERPGEKLHEVLVSEDEMPRARETEDYFIIGKDNANNKRWEYTSQNTNQITGEALKKWLGNWILDGKEV